MSVPAPPAAAPRPTLSVVVPCLNEAAGLAHFHDRLTAALAPLALDWEVIYIDDGSADDTLDVLQDLARAEPRVGLLALSRRFGKEIAMTAGLDHARGEAVIVIDADLQDPPELIPDLVAGWRQGYDMVVRAAPPRATARRALKRATAGAVLPADGAHRRRAPAA